MAIIPNTGLKHKLLFIQWKTDIINKVDAMSNIPHKIITEFVRYFCVDFKWGYIKSWYDIQMVCIWTTKL